MGPVNPISQQLGCNGCNVILLGNTTRTSSAVAVLDQF